MNATINNRAEFNSDAEEYSTAEKITWTRILANEAFAAVLDQSGRIKAGLEEEATAKALSIANQMIELREHVEISRTETIARIDKVMAALATERAVLAVYTPDQAVPPLLTRCEAVIQKIDAFDAVEPEGADLDEEAALLTYTVVHNANNGGFFDNLIHKLAQ